MFIGPCIILIVEYRETNLMSFALLFHYIMLNIHPQELATSLLSYFMGCVALVGCVLVLRCGLDGVVWCGIRIRAEALALVLQPAPGHTPP